MKAVLLGVCFLSLAALTLTPQPQLTASASGSPTAEFLVAALKQQDEACGKSIEVKYKYNGNSDVHYIRTPEVTYIKFTMPDGFTTIASEDKAKGEFRQLTCSANSDQKSAIVKNTPVAALGSNLVLDTSRYNLDATSLSDVVSRCTVQGRETLDGGSWWKVESSAKRADIDKYRIWLDPDVGYCPRKVEVAWKSKKPQTIEFKNYKNLGNGIWFPMEISNKTTVPVNTPTLGKPGDTLELLSKVEEVNIGKIFAKDDLIVQFPSGTEVRDDIRNAVYTVP